MGMFRSKKGSSGTGEEEVYWIPKMIFTIAVASLTFFIIKAFIATTVNVGGLESALLTNLPQFSKDGFSKFDDKTGRVYPGVVDEPRFTTARMERIFKMKKPLIIGRFVLNQTAMDYMQNRQQVKVACAEPRVACTDSERYRIWQPIAQVRGKGEGGKTPYSEVRYATLANGKGVVVETVFIASN
ncbi:hypothetical protein HYV85_03080 [Candidatus Woesearchaeota archaeon]|nr:hypothetical protein [Candidatus Woesearchaeota archaeon]